MSSIYKMLETYDKSNKILQATKEDEIVVSLGKHYRRVNEMYNKLKYDSEKQKLEDNARILSLQEKLKLLEEETSKNLKQCGELEDLVKTYKEKLNENQRSIQENTSYYEKEIENVKQNYGQKLMILQEEIERLKQDNDHEFMLVRKLESLDHMPKDGLATPFSDCETANTSFQDCLPFEKESKVESLIQKIEKLLVKNGDGTSVLEHQLEKLQKQLEEAKEQCIIDRQMARNANLCVWKLEKQASNLENDKRTLSRKLDFANSKIDELKGEAGGFEPKLLALKEEITAKEKVIAEIMDSANSVRNDKDLERDLRIAYEQECVKQKSEIMEHLAKIKTVEEKLITKTLLLNSVQKKNDELIAEQQKLQYKLNKIDDTCTKINSMATTKNNELDTLRKNYELLKKACLITEKQISELENRLKKETDLRVKYFEKCHSYEAEKMEMNKSIKELTLKLTQETEMRQSAESNVSKFSANIEKNTNEINTLQDKIKDIDNLSIGKSTQINKLQAQVEQLSDETLKLRQLIRAHEKHINFLKEDNTKVLSDLYTAREEIESQKQAQDEADRQLNNLMKEINFKEGIIEEQKNCQTKMDVKSTTMIAQYKKMIEFLQNKVEATEKKKKGLKLFG